MGDIPFGISYYSADVFAHPERFALDWSGGAPPEPYFKDDDFTQKWGQNWGIPLYRWDVMRSQQFRLVAATGARRAGDFSPLPDRSRARILPHLCLPLASAAQPRISALELGGNARTHRVAGNRTLRRAMIAPGKTAKRTRREGEEYLRVVLEEAGATRVVGEDLGTVPDYVRPSMRSLGIAGFKIPQWENDPDNRSIPGKRI